MDKQTESTPQIKAHAPYGWLTRKQQADLMTWARELGDLETTNLVLRQRFKKKYKVPLSRHNAIYWRKKAFNRQLAHSKSVSLSRETATQVEELINAERFVSIGEVVAEGINRLYCEMEAERSAKEEPIV